MAANGANLFAPRFFSYQRISLLRVGHFSQVWSRDLFTLRIRVQVCQEAPFQRRVPGFLSRSRAKLNPHTPPRRKPFPMGNLCGRNGRPYKKRRSGESDLSKNLAAYPVRVPDGARSNTARSLLACTTTRPLAAMLIKEPNQCADPAGTSDDTAVEDDDHHSRPTFVPQSVQQSKASRQ